MLPLKDWGCVDMGYMIVSPKLQQVLNQYLVCDIEFIFSTSYEEEEVKISHI